MILEKLKKETQVHHAGLEKLLVGRLKTIRDQNDYAELINTFYGYYFPLEQAVDRFVNTALFPDYDIRRKSASLHSDPQSLNYTYATTFAPHPSINDISEAIGAMYVMEGSTLGGQIIVSMLARALPGLSGCYSFFYSYGEQTPVMWQAFRHQVNAHEPLLNEHAMIRGAQQTFTGLHDWFKQRN